MFGVLLVMQAAGATPTATPTMEAQPAPQAESAGQPQPAPQAPTAPLEQPAPQPQPSQPYAPYPYYPYPYPYPYAQPPPPPRPPPAAASTATRERELTAWFVRIELGLGPPGFSEETDLLRVEGYRGTKFWGAVDGGWLIHPNVGIGAWLALSHWSSTPDDAAPGLRETSYFVGGEVPIKFGPRWISLVIAPRIAFCTGQVELGGDAPFQSAFAYGAEIGAFSFKYHFGGSLGILRAPVGPPGEVGRDHDFGGFHVMIGGALDG